MPLSFNAVISRLAASAAPPVFSLVLTINTRISWFVWDRKVNEWATALSDNADGQVDIALRSDVGCTRLPLLGARHKRTVVEHLPHAIALVGCELVASDVAFSMGAVVRIPTSAPFPSASFRHRYSQHGQRHHLIRHFQRGRHHPPFVDKPRHALTCRYSEDTP